MTLFMYNGMKGENNTKSDTTGKATIIKLRKSYYSDWTVFGRVNIIHQKAPCPTLPYGFETKCVARHLSDDKTEIVIPSLSNCTNIFHYPSMKWTVAMSDNDQKLPVLGATLISHDDKIVMLGGFDKPKSTQRSKDIYEFDGQKWKKWPNYLPSAIRNASYILASNERFCRWSYYKDILQND